ncbi:MAG: flagellar biosynthetic protein FliR [Candidatus Latescibacteria bacterium]|nr:flagellar biosynthetic protein FliR [Candidatus Latescibacterota bacterium]
MDIFSITLTDIYHILLVMFRTGALLMTVPLFGHVSIPRILRVWIVLILGFIIYPSTVLSAVQPPPTIVHFTLAIGGEIAIGLLIGFAVIIVFSGVQFAGQLVGLQMGLAVANISDPLGSGQISIVSEFYYLLSLLILITINGHHFIIEALIKCFDLVPVGGAVFKPSLAEYYINLSSMVFVVAVKLAAPVIITLFIINAVLGIIARTVPQMNVFIVGFPLAIGVGLAMIGLTLPVFYTIIEKVFYGLRINITEIIMMLRG